MTKCHVSLAPALAPDPEAAPVIPEALRARWAAEIAREAALVRAARPHSVPRSVELQIPRPTRSPRPAPDASQ